MSNTAHRVHHRLVRVRPPRRLLRNLHGQTPGHPLYRLPDRLPRRLCALAHLFDDDFRDPSMVVDRFAVLLRDPEGPQENDEVPGEVDADDERGRGLDVVHAEGHERDGEEYHTAHRFRL